MLRCQEVAKLVSESMDRPLTFYERMQLWMHLAMCRLCSGFARQMRLIHHAIRAHPDRLAPDDSTEGATALSPEARARIAAAIEETRQ